MDTESIEMGDLMIKKAELCETTMHDGACRGSPHETYSACECCARSRRQNRRLHYARALLLSSGGAAGRSACAEAVAGAAAEKWREASSSQAHLLDSGAATGHVCFCVSAWCQGIRAHFALGRATQPLGGGARNPFPFFCTFDTVISNLS